MNKWVEYTVAQSNLTAAGYNTEESTKLLSVIFSKKERISKSELRSQVEALTAQVAQLQAR